MAVFATRMQFLCTQSSPFGRRLITRMCRSPEGRATLYIRVDLAALALAASCVGALLGGAGAGIARRLGGDAADGGSVAPAVASGALLAPPAALLLPPDDWGAAAAFGALLLGIAWLDLRAGVVHAGLAAPLALLGVTRGALDGALPAAAAGAALGYSLCVGVERAFRALRGRDGLGRGDAWVLGAAGAWVGPGGLGPVLALAAGGALLAVSVRD
ncbi:MAG: prepilin peptidase, partial [Acetobacteraceae bacterium]|nr:prepilin peptidase [Acetobacteraceae bacterium]